MSGFRPYICVASDLAHVLTYRDNESIVSPSEQVSPVWEMANERLQSNESTHCDI